MISRVKLLLPGLILGILLIAPLANVSAAGFDMFKSCDKVGGEATVCKDAKKKQDSKDNSIYGPNGIITKIVNILAVIIGVTAVIIIIVAGIQYMLSTGDATKVNNAKNTILYAVVGLVVALLARTIVLFIIDGLGK